MRLGILQVDAIAYNEKAKFDKTQKAIIEKSKKDPKRLKKAKFWLGKINVIPPQYLDNSWRDKDQKVALDKILSEIVEEDGIVPAKFPLQEFKNTIVLKSIECKNLTELYKSLGI